jgi:hypothetical protein
MRFERTDVEQGLVHIEDDDPSRALHVGLRGPAQRVGERRHAVSAIGAVNV